MAVGYSATDQETGRPYRGSDLSGADGGGRKKRRVD